MIHEIIQKITILDAAFVTGCVFALGGGIRFGAYLAKIVVNQPIKKIEQNYFQLKNEVNLKAEVKDVLMCMREIATIKETIKQQNESIDKRLSDNYRILCVIARNAGLRIDE